MLAESLPTMTVEGAQIVYRRVGKGNPLLVLNGFGATSADWDPSFVDRLASSNELILPNNRGVGGSTDDGRSFDIAKLADDAAQVIQILGIERVSVLGWWIGGFIAQAFAVKCADRVDKLVLLSTDPGGIEADLASSDVWSELLDTSGTPNEQAQRLLFLLFPADQNTDVIDAHCAKRTSLRRARNLIDLNDHAASRKLAAIIQLIRREHENSRARGFLLGLKPCPAFRVYTRQSEMRLNKFQRSARPRSPPFTDGFCVSFHVHFFQPFNAVSHNIFRFFAGRFEQRPEKR